MGRKMTESSRERIIELFNNLLDNRKIIYKYILDNIEEKEIINLTSEERKTIDNINILLPEINCYYIARHFALNSDKLKYFEGIAINGNRPPEPHAWNEINRKIVDKKFSNGRDYLGIEIPKDILSKKDVRGVLFDNDLCEELIKRYKIKD